MAIRRPNICSGLCVTLLIIFGQYTHVFGQVRLEQPPPPIAPPAPLVTEVPPPPPATAGKATKAAAKDKEAFVPGAMVVRFGDGSVLNVRLKDEKLECETNHGKLLIPVADILKIDMSVRVPAQLRTRIDTAIKDLGHEQPKRREAAAADLLVLKERAYAALVQAAQNKEAEKVLEKLKAMVSAETLEMSQFDVIHTRHSKIAGRLKSDSVRVMTFAFGERDMKLGDVLSLRSQSLVANETLRTPLPTSTAPTVGGVPVFAPFAPPVNFAPPPPR